MELNNEEVEKNGKIEEKEGGHTTMSYEEAFEMTGHGLYNRCVLLTSGLCLLSVMVESFVLSYALPAAACDLNLDNSQKGLLSSSAFIGIVSSSHAWGYLSDTRGRRGVMLPSLFLAAIVSILSALSVNYVMFLILRILTGVCLSASAATVYAYLGELHTTNKRAAAIAWASVFISFALILLPALAWLYLTTTWDLPIPLLNINFSPWRAYMITCTIPSVAAGVCLWMLPESPKYLYAKGRTDEASQILIQIYKKNFGNCGDKFKTIKLKYETNSSDVQPSFLKSIWDQTAPLFKPPLLTCILMSFYTQFTIFSVGSGFYLWIPDILNQLLSDDIYRKISVCEALEQRSEQLLNLAETWNSTIACNPIVSTAVFPISLSMGFIFAVTYAFIGVIINKVGKKLILALILAICGAATIVVTLVSEPILAVVLLVILLCLGCAGSVATSVAVDLFPTHLRAMSMCLSLMLGRIGAVVGSTVIGALIDSHCTIPFYIAGANTILCAAITFLWPKVENVRKKMQEKGITNT